MNLKPKSLIKETFSYAVLILIAVFLCYPLVWMFFASFKTNNEIFAGVNLLPGEFNFDAYRDGWKGVAKNTFTRFFTNSFLLVIPTALFTIISSTLVAYGFA